MCQPDSTQPVSTDFWRPGDDVTTVKGTGAEIYRPDVYKLIEKRIDELNDELRALSIDIHGASVAHSAVVAPLIRVRDLQTTPN